MERLDTLGTFRPEGIAWVDLWPLLARGENQKGRPWLQGLLWDLKRAKWILWLEEKKVRDTCVSCGGAIVDGSHKRTLYCSTACRKVAHRRRQSGKLTDWQAQVEKARTTVRTIEKEEIPEAHRWLRRHRKLKSDHVVLPPDLARIDHLPYLPSRCGVGCGTGTCSHTGGLCVFACTGGPGDEEDR
jgi:hypothetical protein